MSIISIIAILIVCFLVGMESILDQFQLHQPIISCTLIGICTGNITEGILLGGTLQMICLGWMNIGAAVAPDAALAGTVSAILVCGPTHLSVSQGIALAIPLSIAGLLFTIIIRTITISFVHLSDTAANKGNMWQVQFYHLFSLGLQGLRVSVLSGLVFLLPAEQVTGAINSLPDFITKGLGVAGGIIVVVGYAMVINMMATIELWPFFFLGFILSVITDLNLIAMGAIGAIIAIGFVAIVKKFDSLQNVSLSVGSQISARDEIDEILDEF